MNIWQQFNLANQSFLSDWRYCILHALGKKILAVINLADFCNSPNHQNKFYAKFSSYMVCAEVSMQWLITDYYSPKFSTNIY